MDTDTGDVEQVTTGDVQTVFGDAKTEVGQGRFVDGVGAGVSRSRSAKSIRTRLVHDDISAEQVAAVQCASMIAGRSSSRSS